MMAGPCSHRARASLTSAAIFWILLVFHAELEADCAILQVSKHPTIGPESVPYGQLVTVRDRFPDASRTGQSLFSLSSGRKDVTEDKKERFFTFPSRRKREVLTRIEEEVPDDMDVNDYGAAKTKVEDLEKSGTNNSLQDQKIPFIERKKMHRGTREKWKETAEHANWLAKCFTYVALHSFVLHCHEKKVQEMMYCGWGRPRNLCGDKICTLGGLKLVIDDDLVVVDVVL
jgi:hypothetical protein